MGAASWQAAPTAARCGSGGAHPAIGEGAHAAPWPRPSGAVGGLGRGVLSRTRAGWLRTVGPYLSAGWA
jgi:hypothetical protein